MTPEPPPATDQSDAYGAIEAAVMETARGRWFLAEYARRNRSADTAVLLSAIARLEAAIAPCAPAPETAEIAARLRAGLTPIQDAAERLLEIAWVLKENGALPEIAQAVQAQAATVAEAARAEAALMDRLEGKLAPTEAPASPAAALDRLSYEDRLALVS